MKTKLNLFTGIISFSLIGCGQIKEDRIKNIIKTDAVIAAQTQKDTLILIFINPPEPKYIEKNHIAAKKYGLAIKEIWFGCVMDSIKEKQIRECKSHNHQILQKLVNKYGQDVVKEFSL